MESNHQGTVHSQDCERYYFACECGACGYFYRDRLVAAKEYELHLKVCNGKKD